MIYAMGIQDRRFVKIGFTASNDVAERAATLQTGCPYEIVPLITVEGTIQQEKSLHSALRDAFCRIRIPMPPNEWYAGRNPFMSEFLSQLSLGANVAMAFDDKYNQNVRQPGKGFTSLEPNIRWPT